MSTIAVPVATSGQPGLELFFAAARFTAAASRLSLPVARAIVKNWTNDGILASRAIEAKRKIS